jgi:hypothetical protein
MEREDHATTVAQLSNELSAQEVRMGLQRQELAEMYAANTMWSEAQRDLVESVFELQKEIDEGNENGKESVASEKRCEPAQEAA